MHIEHMEECVYLAQTLSFTRTAEHFGISQPALSKHISNLEAFIGVKVFTRDTHHVRLTKMGHTVVREMNEVVGAYRSMLGQVRSLYDEHSATMTIAYLRGAAGHAMPMIHDDYMDRFPDTRLYYRVYSWPEIYRAFMAGEADIAICGGTSEPPDRKFERRLLYIDRFQAVVPPNHPLAGKKSLDVKDLVGYKIDLPARALLPDDAEMIGKYLRSASCEIDTSVNIMDFESVPLVLRLDNAITISASNIRHYYNDDELKFIPLRDCPLSFPIYIYWRAVAMNPRMKAFVDIAERYLQEQQERVQSFGG